MNTSLAPCPACQRHVQLVESACPFCAAPLEALAPPTFDVSAAPRRVAHVALALGTSLALGACPSPPPSVAGVYGAAPLPRMQPPRTDGGASAASTPTPTPTPTAAPTLSPQPAPAVSDDGSRAEVYGAPPAPRRTP